MKRLREKPQNDIRDGGGAAKQQPDNSDTRPNTAAILGLAALMATTAASGTQAQATPAAPAKPAQAKTTTQLAKIGSMTAAKLKAAPARPLTPAQMKTQLAAIEKFVEDNRQKLHIPGASLVIVDNGKIIYMKGMGLRDMEQKLPVTPDTLFAIGSSSKAFTALTVMQSQDDGKLKTTDPPRKYLSYFKMRDPETDKKITISDLLCHRSGLNRTDLAWAPGVLNSEEIIRVACAAKPTAKLGEKFQYQNIMFLTAGTIVGAVQGKSWQNVVAERVFQPLGMTATETSIQQMQAAPDHALGYAYNEDKKQTEHLPMRELTAIAPAGAINSNARDMAKWVRFMLDSGVTPGGKRLVSSAGFADLTRPHMAIGGGISYGYGWFLRDWHGHKVVEHGGNIDGFNAQVALMPDQHLGFALLTNVSASPLGASTMESVWQNLVGSPETESAAKAAAAKAANVGPAVDPASEVGTYHLDAPALDIVVTYADGKLTAKPTGQPEVTLTRTTGRRYKASPPAPEGYFMTFRPAVGKSGKPDLKTTELVMEMPGGAKMTLHQEKSDPNAKKDEAPVTGPLAELVGTYENAAPSFQMEIAQKSGKVSLVVPGQPPYPLEPAGKDTYKLGGTPPGFTVTVSRDAGGKVAGILLKQPQGNLNLKRLAGFQGDMTVDALMAKVIEAAGGEANLRKHHSLTVKSTLDYANQGVTGESLSYLRAPDSVADVSTLTAAGKTIGTIREYFDGTHGGTVISFAPSSEKAGKGLEQAKNDADFYAELNWKTRYPTVTIKRMAKVEGEDCYVVEKKPATGNPVTDYVSAKTFLVVKRDSVISSGITDTALPISTLFRDYRDVDGVKIPFVRAATIPEMGESNTTIKEATFDAPIDDSVFAPPLKAGS